MLELRLLGQPTVLVAGEPHLLPPKRLALSAYLALASAPVRRAALADLFWNEGDEVARRNLRQELHRLRQGVLAPYLELAPDTVNLKNVQCDALDFQHAPAHKALQLYRGPLLDGLQVHHAERFDEWLEQKRASLHTHWLELRRAHATALEQQEQWEAALEAITPLLEHPDEAAAAQAMRLHAGLGRPLAAAEVFMRLQQQLRDLGGEVSAEVLGLHARLRGETTRPLHTPSRASLTQPPMIGRDDLLAQVLGELQQNSPLVVLEGEPGSGKSTLAQAVGVRWGSALKLQGEEGLQNLPFMPLIAVFRQHLPALHELPSATQAEVSRLIPELSPQTTAPGDLHGEGRARFLAALSDALHALRGHRLLWLDDLHWLDAATLEVLLIRTPQAWPGVATLRSLEGTRNPAASQFLSTQQQRGRLIRHDLPPLSETDTLRLIRALAPPGTTATRFARRLHESTQGNPLFLLETLKTLLASGDLREENGQWHTNFDAATDDYHELPLPASVSGAVQARLESLNTSADGALMHLLGAAALLGRNFGVEELAESTPLDEWKLLDTLEQAVSAGLFTRQGETYRFSHGLVQRSILEALSPERRRFLHRRLAATLEHLNAPAAQLAPHLEGSGQKERAAQMWLRAADQAAQVYAHLETLNYLERALKVGLPDDQALATHLRRADTYRTLDQRPAWKAALQDAAALQGTEDPGLQLRFIELDFYSGHYEEVLQAVQRLQNNTLTAEQRGWAALWRGNAYNRTGRMGDAMQAYEEALSAAPAEALELRGRILNAWAYAASQVEQIELGQEKIREAIQIFEQLGHRRGLAMAYSTAGSLAYAAEQDQDAARLYKASLKLAEEIGDKPSQRTALVTLGAVYLNLKDFDAALEATNSGLELLEELPDPYSECFLLQYLATIYAHRKQWSHALRQLEKSISLADTYAFQHLRLTSRMDYLGTLVKAGSTLTDADTVVLNSLNELIDTLPDDQKTDFEAKFLQLRQELASQ